MQHGYEQQGMMTLVERRLIFNQAMCLKCMSSGKTGNAFRKMRMQPHIPYWLELCMRSWKRIDSWGKDYCCTNEDLCAIWQREKVLILQCLTRCVKCVFLLLYEKVIKSSWQWEDFKWGPYYSCFLFLFLSSVWPTIPFLLSARL